MKGLGILVRVKKLTDLLDIVLGLAVRPKRPCRLTQNHDSQAGPAPCNLKCAALMSASCSRGSLRMDQNLKGA